MLVHAGKYRTEDGLKIETIQEVNTTQKKQTMQNTAKQDYLGLVAFYDTQTRKEVGLFSHQKQKLEGNSLENTSQQKCCNSTHFNRSKSNCRQKT